MPRLSNIALVWITSTVSTMVIGAVAAAAMVQYVVMPDLEEIIDSEIEEANQHRAIAVDILELRRAMALAYFADGRPLCCGTGTVDLTSWSQLREFLDEGSSLWQALASSQVFSDNDPPETLRRASPWGSYYSFAVDPCSPNQFEFRIGNVERDRFGDVDHDLVDVILFITGAVAPPVLGAPQRDLDFNELRVVYPL